MTVVKITSVSELNENLLKLHPKCFQQFRKFLTIGFYFGVVPFKITYSDKKGFISRTTYSSIVSPQNTNILRLK